MFALPKRFHPPKNLVSIINLCAEQVVVGIFAKLTQKSAVVRHVFSVCDLLCRYFMIDLHLICMRLCYVPLLSTYSYLCDIYGGNML